MLEKSEGMDRGYDKELSMFGNDSEEICRCDWKIEAFEKREKRTNAENNGGVYQSKIWG